MAGPQAGRTLREVQLGYSDTAGDRVAAATRRVPAGTLVEVTGLGDGTALIRLPGTRYAKVVPADTLGPA